MRRGQAFILLLYSSLIRCSSFNHRTLWNTINNILHRTVKLSPNSFSPLSALPQMFAFLPIKYQNFISTYNPTHLLPSLTTYHLILLHFSILPLSPYRKSHIYIPTHLPHIVTLILFPFLEKIAKEIALATLSVANLSLLTSTIPSSLKSSLISTLLKNLPLIKKTF